jgi:GTPase SAR1 family protein
MRTPSIYRWLGDVGGQKTLRTYWKNYFEKTDTLIWVVDSTDAERLVDCREELKKLLVEEVRSLHILGRKHYTETDMGMIEVDGRFPPCVQEQE